jgi:hypothetical protein
MKTINPTLALILVIASVSMAFTSPTPLNGDVKLPTPEVSLPKKPVNILTYLSKDQIMKENRINLEQMSPEARKKIAEMTSKLASERKREICLYIYNECMAAMDNYCKLNLKEQIRAANLTYRMGSDSQKLFHNAKYDCGVYMIYYDCYTGYVIIAVQSPYWS